MARQALMGLGFTPQEADRLLADATGESAEELIEHALRTRGAAAA
jgi:Holliday junction resolvasome RuvABC DNA-binding subunit